MISIICFSCSVVIFKMLNTFIKNNNYFKPKVTTYMEMEAFEQTLSLQKDGDGGFCKNTSYWYSCI